MRRSGFSLLEVLFALLVISVGVLALLSTAGPIARLANDGRERSRIAQALDTRLGWLTTRVRQSGSCLVPPSGTDRWPDGGGESWSAAARGRGIEFLAIAWTVRRRQAPDSALSRMPCP